MNSYFLDPLPIYLYNVSSSAKLDYDVVTTKGKLYITKYALGLKFICFQRFIALIMCMSSRIQWRWPL